MLEERAAEINVEMPVFHETFPYKSAKEQKVIQMIRHDQFLNISDQWYDRI